MHCQTEYKNLKLLCIDNFLYARNDSRKIIIHQEEIGQ
jgi:hypothetical protein